MEKLWRCPRKEAYTFVFLRIAQFWTKKILIILATYRASRNQTALLLAIKGGWLAKVYLSPLFITGGLENGVQWGFSRHAHTESSPGLFFSAEHSKAIVRGNEIFLLWAVIIQKFFRIFFPLRHSRIHFARAVHFEFFHKTAIIVNPDAA